MTSSKLALLTGLLFAVTGCSSVNSNKAPLTPADMLAAARAEIIEVSPQDGQTFAADAIVLDVREPAEFTGGHLVNAVNIPRGTLEWRIGRLDKLKVLDDEARRNQPILVYCRSGARAALATQTLQQLGYQNVRSIAGGYLAWEKAGLPTSDSQSKSE